LNKLPSLPRISIEPIQSEGSSAVKEDVKVKIELFRLTSMTKQLSIDLIPPDDFGAGEYNSVAHAKKQQHKWRRAREKEGNGSTLAAEIEMEPGEEIGPQI
jgi:hypothetical protein